MNNAAEQAQYRLEEGVAKVMALMRGALYGLRVAAKRVGDLASSGGSIHAIHGKQDMESLIEALEQADENLSDAAVLALGDHFREFLRGALGLEERPPLPGTVKGVETLAGTPGALGKIDREFAILLQLYRVALEGGVLDRTAMDALGGGLELVYAGGKVKMFQTGDRVALGEEILRDAGIAVEEAGRAIRRKLDLA